MFCAVILIYEIGKLILDIGDPFYMIPSLFYRTRKWSKMNLDIILYFSTAN